MGSAAVLPGVQSGFIEPTKFRTTSEASIPAIKASSCMNHKLVLNEGFPCESHFEGIIGQSEALRHVLRQVETVADSNSTVLLLGETGTGKELIARALHGLSSRRNRAFIKVNSASIPSGLLESELFGHERGAFTGAITQKAGRLELADHGTVFLDEVGDIPLELQPKLLRVLQEREFERLGAARTRKVDVRLVAATHRDLERMMAENQFRGDLYYRLYVFPIEIPPLRERPEDIPFLAWHFVQQFSRRVNKHIETIPAETMQALTRYHWPGNIRELQNVIERAVILSSGPVLRIGLPQSKQLVAIGKGTLSEQETLEQAVRNHILAALEDTDWVVAGPNGAAARLGINRSTLQFRMHKLGLFRGRIRLGAVRT
jgi:formate hydrogenlyase transcriptional activator